MPWAELGILATLAAGRRRFTRIAPVPVLPYDAELGETLINVHQGAGRRFGRLVVSSGDVAHCRADGFVS
jgi:hypothetical protein